MLTTAELYFMRSKAPFHFPVLLQRLILSLQRNQEDNMKWIPLSFGLEATHFCTALEILKKHEELAVLLMWSDHEVLQKLSQNIFPNVTQKCLV